jgi:hypothetical protein
MVLVVDSHALVLGVLLKLLTVSVCCRSKFSVLVPSSIVHVIAEMEGSSDSLPLTFFLFKSMF